MSKQYLYVFGYEDPSERRANMSLGTDYESSDALFIIAEDEKQALEWGHEISERYVCLLHEDDSISWKKDGFAAWIEHDPDEFFRDSTYVVSEVPVVRCGEYPDFAAMFASYG